MNVPESPGNNEINDVLSLLLHVSHRVSVKKSDLPGLVQLYASQTESDANLAATILVAMLMLSGILYFSSVVPFFLGYAPPISGGSRLLCRALAERKESCDACRSNPSGF